MSNITHTEIRMYRMGTGDCFVLKFFSGEQLSCKIMIDCGTWSGSQAHLEPYIKDLKTYVENQVDILVITHEHKDHVYVFEACEHLFIEGFNIGQIWMAWTEEESAAKVKQWQKDYGDQKRALGKAAKKLKQVTASEAFIQQFVQERNGMQMLGLRQQMADDIFNFTELQLSTDADGNYIGALAGMKVVKEKLAKSNVKYFKPGDLITQISQLPGIRFYVLGPPESWEQVKKESGGQGESYDHNRDLTVSDAFAMAVLHGGNREKAKVVLPFDESYNFQPAKPEDKGQTELYDSAPWRKIDFDWLYSTGALAMRINSITNNLSLALAIEFEESGRVMLFPGDAEYGSWESWHQLNWPVPSRNKDKPLMEDLLNRTVFYKVAHHLSHNGTAKKLGMDMMIHPELAAMATLDYNTISSQWKTTMPNRGLLQDLIRQSSGRLMVMNTDHLYYDIGNEQKLADQIELARSRMNPAALQNFNDNMVDDPLYFQFRVSGTR